MTAKSLAQSIKSGAVAPLSIALSVAINIALLISFLTELVRAFPGLELRLFRGNSAEVVELLKKGEVEIAIAGPLDELWDRLDAWPLFSEPYQLAFAKAHRLAKQNGSIAAHELAKEHWLCRTYCEHAVELSAFFYDRNGKPANQHKVVFDHDLVALLEANLGIAIVPRSSIYSSKIECLPVDDLHVMRTVSVYGVAGRQRSTAANTLIKMLRAADWSEYETAAVA